MNYYLVELEYYQGSKTHRTVFYFMEKDEPEKIWLILQLDRKSVV